MSSSRSGFTLFEIIITMALLTLLVIVVYSSINIKAQIDKGNDARRKGDLKTMQNLLDDFYSDKDRYPLPSEICYDGNDTLTTCHICGNEYTPPQFIAYARKLPCDPQHDAKTYLYEIDDPNTPQWYRIFAKFNQTNDPQSCGTCGPTGNLIYSYGVSSPNKNIAD